MTVFTSLPYCKLQEVSFISAKVRGDYNGSVQFFIIKKTRVGMMIQDPRLKTERGCELRFSSCNVQIALGGERMRLLRCARNDLVR
ncbi:MAG: hypothetical protein ACYST6_10795 [Planctomycetota bacterium]